jgi:hypothetical protein
VWPAPWGGFPLQFAAWQQGTLLSPTWKVGVPQPLPGLGIQPLLCMAGAPACLESAGDVLKKLDRVIATSPAFGRGRGDLLVFVVGVRPRAPTIPYTVAAGLVTTAGRDVTCRT